MRPSKVLIVGLDGADWYVLDDLMANGYMKNLKALTEEGIRATLMSTIPPVSGPAWLSIATGLNPCKLGIFDFLYRKSPNSFRLTPISSIEFRGRAIWDILSRKGWRVGIINYPMLWPPYPINGFMISGIGSPKSEGITYPARLEDQLNELADG